VRKVSETSSVLDELRTLIRTGKYVKGSRKTIKLLKLGKLKMVIVASTLRQDLKDDILYYARLGEVPVYIYPGSGYELGAMLGRPHMVSALGVLDMGASRLNELVKG